jgi:hypothetical protein
VQHGAFPEPRWPARPARDARERLERARPDWRAARPIFLPFVLEGGVRRFAREIRASSALFERLRAGADFGAAVWKRLGTSSSFRRAGAVVDLTDPREIVKIHADVVRGGRAVARDLYAKLSWVGHDERDESLRVRFSFGSEALCDWQDDARRARWADRYAEAVFPECAVLTGQRELVRFVEDVARARLRFSERIVYANAPGGGALFHHDSEPRQRGVLFGQLAGETAWLTLPARELAAELAAFAHGTRHARRARDVRAALAWLARQEDPLLQQLLNHTPAFTRRLVERGALVHLCAGDALLLPSPSASAVCWHSVFALGRRASLAHSYGIFERGAGRP